MGRPWKYFFSDAPKPECERASDEYELSEKNVSFSGE